MKAPPYRGSHRPFKNLGALLEHKKIALSPGSDSSSSAHHPNPISMTEQKDVDIFKAAMADVTPLNFNKKYPLRKQPKVSTAGQDDDQLTVTALKALIGSGRGFIVSQTPEYMESANDGAGAEILRRLHQGHFAIQDFVDLHGYRVPEAEKVLGQFVQHAIHKGLRTVLIVHGRGLTSPKEPVLKQKVYTWLTSGHLRKWVVALTSARKCDGGAGATYVLLRRRPMTKSQRKKLRNRR
jgi:DNA-nicking Smr family endonuclease